MPYRYIRESQDLACLSSSIFKRKKLIIKFIWIIIFFTISSTYLRVSHYSSLLSDIYKLFRLVDNAILAGDFNSRHIAWCAAGITDNVGETLYHYYLKKLFIIAIAFCSTGLTSRIVVRL